MALKWEATRFGGPEALGLVKEDVPPPRAGEVVVDVRRFRQTRDLALPGRRWADPGRLAVPDGYTLWPGAHRRAGMPKAWNPRTFG
jgi:hypothetical protein